jgi:alginate O-acetyltransferase complex protein AlgI
MLFHSLNYLLLFLPCVFILYFLLRSYTNNDGKYLLIIFGIFFYGWWNIKLTPLIICSILFNYFAHKIIIGSSNAKKKLILIFSIFCNVIYLGIFKYIDFIILNLNYIFQYNLETFNFPFPLAMSFITFQTIAYLVDCYDGETKASNFKDYALFIIFFPQLIAGPIVKFNYMLSQFNSSSNRFINLNNILLGLTILLIGVFKKIVLADNLSTNVEFGFNNFESINFVEAWITSFSFTFQIYFDFSGYIDMAIGSALLFNILLPKNFDSPFKALNLINFWKTWHITLFNFLMNYLYYPILRSWGKINFFKAMVVTIIVFIISGLWHGPTYGYIIFGALHGVGIVINHIFKKIKIIKLHNVLSWLITILYVNFTFIFFRCENLDSAYTIIKTMFGFNGFDLNTNFFENYYLISIYLLSILIIFFFKNTNYLIENYFKKSEKI